MSGSSTSIGVVLGVLFLTSLVSALAATLLFGTPDANDRLGQGRAVALGLATSAMGTFGVLLLLNPDPVALPERFEDYVRRTVVTAGFCAIFWLPLFLSLRALMIRRQT